MNSHPIGRRSILKKLALASAAWPLLGRVELFAGTESPDVEGLARPLKLGVASISLKTLPLEKAIAALQRLDLKYISLYKTHAPWGLDPQKCQEAAEKVRSAGLQLMATGVVTLPNKEETVKKAFECARAAKLPVMTCRPEADAFPLIERYVKEYDLKLAIHNHGPEDKLYPSPYDALKLIEKYDERIGLCMDLGHATRTGIDTAEAIRKCAPRIYDFHIKDTLAHTGAPDVPVEMGRGYIDLPKILQTLIEIKYNYQVGIEYEVEGPGKEDPVPGVAEGVGYLRGIIKMLTTAPVGRAS